MGSGQLSGECYGKTLCSRINVTYLRVQDGVTPRTANANAIKQVKSASKAYDALAEAYQHFNNFPKLKAQIKAGSEIWAEVSG
jgi:hypothetical protein